MGPPLLYFFRFSCRCFVVSSRPLSVSTISRLLLGILNSYSPNFKRSPMSLSLCHILFRPCSCSLPPPSHPDQRLSLFLTDFRFFIPLFFSCFFFHSPSCTPNGLSYRFIFFMSYTSFPSYSDVASPLLLVVVFPFVSFPVYTLLWTSLPWPFSAFVSWFSGFNAPCRVAFVVCVQIRFLVGFFLTSSPPR